MTKFKGMLLFDVPEDTINGWENQLGYRGMMEVWEKGNERITIEPYEDSAEDDEWEVWLSHKDDSGEWKTIGYGTFDEADKLAKEYMANH